MEHCGFRLVVRPRVRVLVFAFQRRYRHRGVDLRRRDRHVTQQLLYDTDVSAVGQHVRGATVPKDVRADAWAVDTNRECALVDDEVDALTTERSPARVQEQWRVLARVGEQAAAAGCEVVTQGGLECRSHRYQTLLRALAGQQDQLLVEVQIAETDADDLRDARARAVEEFEERTVAQVNGRGVG